MTNAEYIQKEIKKLPEGKAFIVADFSDSASNDNIRQIFSRLENNKEIRRILPGIYDKPRFSEILQEEIGPDINSVAEAIARKNNWKIAPDGNTALNLLGLSTQVPANWSYITSGPSNSYKIGNITISFSHRADKILSGMSYKTILVIQSLNALGKENVTSGIISQLAKKMSPGNKKRLLLEAKATTSWIYEEIKKICKEEL